MFDVLNNRPTPQMEMTLFMLVKTERCGIACPSTHLGMTHKEEEEEV